MMPIAAALTLFVASTLTGCEFLNPGKDDDASDASGTPDVPFDPNTGECATNWRVVNVADLGGRAKVDNERLVLRSQGTEVAVEGLLGVPPGGRGAVLRFDFESLALGPDGRFDLEMVSPEGTLSRLIVTSDNVILTVEAIPYGSNAELRLSTPPKRMVFELELKPDNGVQARAFFFEAGRAKVISTSVPRFDGGTTTNVMKLTGATAEVKLERFARVDPGNGGLMEDFWCDSLGTSGDRFRFPEGRASKAGNPCGHDDQCGAGELCVDNYCRRACLASSQCLNNICIVDATGGLCSVPSNDDCVATDGLACGADGKLRNRCSLPNDCPRADDLCLGNACVSNDEAACKGKPWGECKFASERCQSDKVEACDTAGPGWTKVESCLADQCKSTGLTAFCDSCQRSCGGVHAEDVFASCDAGEPSLEVDCKDAFEVCSTGDTNTDEPFCRTIVAGVPASKSVEVGNGTQWGIDPTEVTRAQYAAFLQKSPSTVSQRPECAWNETYRAPDWPWFEAPERAVQVDFCDAQAYCASVGKSLCSASQWYDTCSSGGTSDFPYGDAFESGRCSIDPRRDVGTNPECGAATGPFTGVVDMIGGVGEWTDSCAQGTTTVRAADTCKTRGTSASQGCDVERMVRRDSVAGIRCCSF